jgi:LysM repeat protein
MRVRTWSACVALAWGILLLLTAAGPIGSLRPAPATTRIASSTSNTITPTITTQATLTSAVTSAPADRPEPARASYIVQPGDTLSGIAAALGVPGGWPALYAANRRAIGIDPGLIRPGLILALPGAVAATHYTVAAGDTLSGIAAALGTTGGWPALYTANRPVIGPNPDVIRAGTVLAIPHPGLPATSPLHQRPSASPAPHRTARPSAPAPATSPSGRPVPAQPLTGARPRSRSAQPMSMGGLPRWLEFVLVGAGLLIATAFLTEPVLALARRRRAAGPAAADAHIVLADYERLVVTHSREDGTVYVLRPPGVDPQAILLAARLVLAQDRYEALAGHLGVPAHWPRE